MNYINQEAIQRTIGPIITANSCCNWGHYLGDTESSVTAIAAAAAARRATSALARRTKFKASSRMLFESCQSMLKKTESRKALVTGTEHAALSLSL